MGIAEALATNPFDVYSASSDRSNNPQKNHKNQRILEPKGASQALAFPSLEEFRQKMNALEKNQWQLATYREILGGGDFDSLAAALNILFQELANSNEQIDVMVLSDDKFSLIGGSLQGMVEGNIAIGRPGSAKPGRSIHLDEQVIYRRTKAPYERIPDEDWRDKKRSS